MDKEKWGDTPQVVNCFCDAAKNSVYILGAFAQGNLCNSAMRPWEGLDFCGITEGGGMCPAPPRA